ncbi:4-alpha-glucanotransferase [Rubidibacter lacunae KORDI 51-2]|uniref:4-alpha-glucanotransferase n=2 Tax=Rubidibacter TaxID=582491 RepID=U5DDG8_9CHRO|nr:4-alpha-glucanotransferase [Rubidibacter lacunae KORDI 51-2]
MHLQRASGILLHPTSLPSRYGIGDLGPEAYRFVDFLAGSGQQLWQVLPLGPTGYGNSPYLSYSALAGNPLLISPDILRQEGLLEDKDLEGIPDFPSDRVDFDRVYQTKFPLFHRAFQAFKTAEKATVHAGENDNDGDNEGEDDTYQVFCDRHAHWLDDFALFMAIKDAYGGKGWHRWDEAIARREPEALADWRGRLSEEVGFHKYLQFEFYRQWQNLKTYANERSIYILGDIPIYVAHDSMAVWAHQDIFHLDEETLEPALMAGVPPDYFSKTGQLWGNPVYNWEQIQLNHFKWWLSRFEGTLDYVDIIRIDHFRGFEAFWAVEKGEPDARNGRWIEAPGEEFFTLLNEQLGDLPIVAEDLGIITPEVEALRDRFSFPGMKILHFAFGSDPGNPYLPFNYNNRNCIVYTGTHDNDTTIGWFSQLSDWERGRVEAHLGCIVPEGIQWSLIRMALSSVADLAIVPLQDVLGLGSDARMNTPSCPEGNWYWRYAEADLTDELRDRLRDLTVMFGRAPAHWD